MEFRDYLHLVGRIWPLILCLAVLGGLGGASASVLARPQFESSAKSFVTASGTSSLADLTSGASYAQEAASEYAQIATTAYVLKPVIRDLGLDVAPDTLAQQVTASTATGQAVVTITVVDRSPRQAAAIANAITAQLGRAVIALTPRSRSGAAASIEFTSVDPAVVPSVPIGPKPGLLIGGGLAGGILVAVLIGLLREVVDTRIHSREDLARVTELPVLGTTVHEIGAGRDPLPVASEPRGRRAESYRSLRTNLRFVELDSATRSLVVTSSLEGEGKTTTAANLALAMSDLGERVLLVDADLRRPGIGSVFSVDESVGLTDVVIGQVPLERAVQRGPNGLSLLPAGTIPPNPNELLQSASMRALLDRLHEEYDLVIFDTPPLLPVSDAAALAGSAGGTLLVSAVKAVRRAQLEGALRTLELPGARVVGLVLTNVPRRAEVGSYGYGAQEGPRRRTRKQLPTRLGRVEAR